MAVSLSMNSPWFAHNPIIDGAGDKFTTGNRDLRVVAEIAVVLLANVLFVTVNPPTHSQRIALTEPVMTADETETVSLDEW